MLHQSHHNQTDATKVSVLPLPYSERGSSSSRAVVHGSRAQAGHGSTQTSSQHAPLLSVPGLVASGTEQFPAPIAQTSPKIPFAGLPEMLQV